MSKSNKSTFPLIFNSLLRKFALTQKEYQMIKCCKYLIRQPLLCVSLLPSKYETLELHGFVLPTWEMFNFPLLIIILYHTALTQNYSVHLVEQNVRHIYLKPVPSVVVSDAAEDDVIITMTIVHNLSEI